MTNTNDNVKPSTYNKNIEDIYLLVEEDVKIINSVFGDTQCIKENTILESNAFKSYLVINTDIRDNKSATYKSLKAQCGIYVFKMLKNCAVPNDFNMYVSCAKLNDYKLKTFEKDKYLYVGKSKKILGRIHDHFGNPESKVSSLKLSWEVRKELKESCVMIIFLLKDEYKKYKDIILPIIEKELHNKFKPLVGGSRV